MKKFMVVAMPVFTLCIFILVMLSGNFLKKPLGEKDNIPLTIEMLIDEVRNENWEQASSKTDELQEGWEKVVKRVQFSSERDEINAFGTSIARLKGAIIAKDRAGALMELKEAYEHWDELGN